MSTIVYVYSIHFGPCAKPPAFGEVSEGGRPSHPPLGCLERRPLRFATPGTKGSHSGNGFEIGKMLA